jgi:hypothetical protein
VDQNSLINLIDKKPVDDAAAKQKGGKRKKKERTPLPPARSAFDATTTMLRAKAPLLSSKINYDLLKDVLE